LGEKIMEQMRSSRWYEKKKRGRHLSTSSSRVIITTQPFAVFTLLRPRITAANEQAYLDRFFYPLTSNPAHTPFRRRVCEWLKVLKGRRGWDGMEGGKRRRSGDTVTPAGIGIATRKEAEMAVDHDGVTKIFFPKLFSKMENNKQQNVKLACICQ